MSIESRFDEYDKLNPEVWSLFIHYAFQAYFSGLSRISSSMIIDRIRWERNVVTRGDEVFKINDQFTAYYARKFREAHPDRADMFTTRALRSHERKAA